MRSKDKTVLNAIEAFICDYTDLNGYSPSMQEIADKVGVPVFDIDKLPDYLRRLAG